MNNVFGWIVAIFLGLVACAFFISEILIVMGIIHYRKDREMCILLAAVAVTFVAFCAAAAYGALAIGRQLV